MQPLPAKILKGLKNEQFRENDTIVLKALIAGYPYPRVSYCPALLLCVTAVMTLASLF